MGAWTDADAQETSVGAGREAPASTRPPMKVWNLSEAIEDEGPDRAYFADGEPPADRGVGGGGDGDARADNAGDGDARAHNGDGDPTTRHPHPPPFPPTDTATDTAPSSDLPYPHDDLLPISAVGPDPDPDIIESLETQLADTRAVSWGGA